MASVKVISLERSTERRRAFASGNPGLDHEFFPGVDGRSIPDAILHDRRLFIDPLPAMSPGARGCALSHLKLWEMAIRLNRPISIAEDDALFRRDFATASARVLAKLPADWDFILWGWNFDSILSVHALPNVAPIVMVSNQDSLRKNAELYLEQTTESFPLRLDKCFGTPAYTISPGGASKFRAACFPLTEMNVWFPLLNRMINNRGIDIAMNKIYSETNSFVAFPPLAITRNEHEASTVLVRPDPI